MQFEVSFFKGHPNRLLQFVACLWQRFSLEYFDSSIADEIGNAEYLLAQQFRANFGFHHEPRRQLILRVELEDGLSFKQGHFIGRELLALDPAQEFCVAGQVKLAAELVAQGSEQSVIATNLLSELVVTGRAKFHEREIFG